MSERFFEIRKNGKPVDDIGYASLGGAALAWEAGDPTGTEVVELNISKEVVRTYSPEECHQAARDLRNPG